MKKLLITFMILCCYFVSQSQVSEGTSNKVVIEIGDPTATPAEKREAKITLEDLGITKLPTYRALIIGVSEYAYAGPGLPNLEKPVQDAELLASVLMNKYAFDEKNVTVLKSPTREGIINAFDQMAELSTEKDNLLIFYAGHGVYDKEKDFGYWLPSDAKKTSRSAWIANSQIKDYVGAIKSKHTLLITDACFGGSIFKTRSVELIVKRFYELYRPNSRKAMTSGNLTEVADQSVFLKYLIKTLDENEDVFLSSSSLFTRIYDPILNNASSTTQFGIIQGAGDEGGDFIFIKRD